MNILKKLFSKKTKYTEVSSEEKIERKNKEKFYLENKEKLKDLKERWREAELYYDLHPEELEYDEDILKSRSLGVLFDPKLVSGYGKYQKKLQEIQDEYFELKMNYFVKNFVENS